MTTIKKATVTELKNEVLHGTKFSVCPCCRSKDLLKFEVDHFCMKCDWNSIVHDVDSGNFEKRIGLTTKNRARKTNGDADVIYLSEREHGAAKPALTMRRKP